MTCSAHHPYSPIAYSRVNKLTGTNEALCRCTWLAAVEDEYGIMQAEVMMHEWGHILDIGIYEYRTEARA